MSKTTVYPARAGAFPAASFPTFMDALHYVHTLQPAPSGVCLCPARSFDLHYPDTVDKGK